MTAHPSTGSRNAGLIAIAVGGAGLFLAALDFSINVSLPTMRDSLQASLVSVQWIIIVYHASRSGLGFAVGAIADRFSLRGLFLVGAAAYTVAVGLISMQDSLPGVVALRVLQGVGAGILFTAGPALVARAFEAARRGAALGVTLAAVAGGQIVGTLGGGWLSANVGWEAIFWTRVPVGVLVFALAAVALPSSRPILEGGASPGSEGRGFDWPGAGILFAALFLLVFALALARLDGWLASLPVALGGAALVGLAGFVMWERRAAAPLFPLSLLRVPEFRAGAASNLLATVASFVMWFLFPFYIVDSLGRGSIALGALLSAMAASGFAGSAAGGWIADRFGDRSTTAAGAAITACGLAWIGTLGGEPGLFAVGASAGLTGLGFGVHQAAAYALTMRGTPRRHAGAGSAALAVTQTVGTVASIAVMTSIFSWREGTGGGTPAAFVAAFRETYFAAALVALAAGAVAVGLRPGRR